MRHKHLGGLLALTILAVAVGCNGSGSGSTTPATPVPAAASGSFTVVTGGNTYFSLPGVGTTTAGAATFAAPTSGGGTAGTFSVSATNPVATALLGDKKPASVAGANGLWYLTLTFKGQVVLAALPSFQLEFASPQPATVVYWSAIYDSSASTWTEPWTGPGVLSNGGSTLAIPAKTATPYTFKANVPYTIAIYSSPATPTPTPSPSPTPSPTPATPTPSPTPNAIVNGDFETGGVITPWYICRTGHPTLAASVNASPVDETPAPTYTQAPTTVVPPLGATPIPDPAVVTTIAAASAGNPNTAPHGGTHAAQIGQILTGTGNAREKGIVGICQDVTVPAATTNPTIVFWVWEGGNVGNFSGADVEADIFSGATWTTGGLSLSGATYSGKQTTANPAATLFAETNCYNNNGTSGGSATTSYPDCTGQAAAPGTRGGQWVKKGPYSLNAYGGQSITVLLGVWSSSNSPGYYDYLYADDIVLTHS